MISASELVSQVEQLPLGGIEDFISGLCPCLPLAALVKLGEAVAAEISSRTELDAMRDAVKGADAAVDAAEQASLEIAGKYPEGGA